jgi:hypothetical protein
MVFFTCVIVVLVLYYLQGNGLIYVTIIAVMAELINLFMTQTMTKSAEKQTSKKFIKVIKAYKAKIAEQKKTIKEFQDLQEKAIKKLHKANSKIKEYEDRAKEKGNSQTNDKMIKPSQRDDNGMKKKKQPETIKVPKKKAPEPEKFIDLPSGSNKKPLPI